MKKNDIARRAKGLLDDLSVPVGLTGELDGIRPPDIGTITAEDEVLAVTEQDITNDIPKNTGESRELYDSYDPIELPRGLEEVLPDFEEALSTNPNGVVSPTQPASARKEWEPCAWYSPIHYFGSSWGIFIREDCVTRMAVELGSYINQKKVRLSSRQLLLQSRNAIFYYLYFHEQFHHKIESLGFRFLLAHQADFYRQYKAKIYRPTLFTADCLEESLANAEAFIRFSEPRYSERLSSEVIRALREFALDEMVVSPAGYREGVNYLTDGRFKNGHGELLCRFAEISLKPRNLSPHMWLLGTNMTRGMMNITTEIYTIVRRGRSSIFGSAFDPKFTTSTRKLARSLCKHYGFEKIAGQGKGSHEKYAAEVGGSNKTIILSGNRKDLPIKDIKDAIGVVTGTRDLSLLPALLEGTVVFEKT